MLEVDVVSNALQAKEEGLCQVGDQVVVSQCPSQHDCGMVKVRSANSGLCCSKTKPQRLLTMWKLGCRSSEWSKSKAWHVRRLAPWQTSARCPEALMSHNLGTIRRGYYSFRHRFSTAHCANLITMTSKARRTTICMRDAAVRADAFASHW